MNNIQDSQLLRDNRSALVAQLNDLGFRDVNDTTPLSTLAGYIRWAGGLRDLRLATINKLTGAYADYSEDEWIVLSASAKASCIKLGLRIRAESQDFIISKDYVLGYSGETTMPWSSSLVDVKGLTNYGSGSTGHLLDIDGKANTDLILAHAKSNNITMEAAERARAYKASTIADGGYDDPTVWSLPAIGQLWLLYKYRDQINAALTIFFGPAYILSDIWHWSSTEYDGSHTWYINLLSATLHGYMLKTTRCAVRAVASVPSDI